jgi:hypothetical protein
MMRTMRITIEIGQSKRMGGLEAFGLGMLVPLVLDLLWPGQPATPDAPPAPAPFAEWMHRIMMAAVHQGTPAERTSKSRLSEFMEELMRDLRPNEREVLRRRFGGERPASAPAPESPAGV